MRNPLLPQIHVPDPLDYPTIEPVPDSVQRPYWSVMIPTYNRPDYLREVLISIIEQAPPPEDMQIMVVDNASTVGDIAGIVQDVGGGRIEYHRHPENIGLNRNWTSCIQLARGHYVHMMHDDDLVMPGFYAAYRQHIETYGCNVMFSQAVSVDDERRWHRITRRVAVRDGVVVNPLEVLFQYHTFNMNSLVASRDLYEQIGGYLSGLHHGCDHEICARLLRVGKVGFTDRPYVMARQHQGQDSRKNLRESNMIHDYFLGFQLALNDSDTPANRRLVYDGLRDLLYNMSLHQRHLRYYSNALYLGWWAFRTSPNLQTAAHLVNTLYQRYIGLWLTGVRSLLGRFKRTIIGRAA